MYAEGFPSKLKKARNDTGFTQREVAKETGIPLQHLSKLRSRKNTADIETLGKLADFYGVSVDWLLGTTGKKNTPVQSQ